MGSATTLLRLAAVLAFASTAAAAEPQAHVHQDGSRWILENDCVQRVVETQPFLHTVSVTNKLSGGRVQPVESQGFVLSLDGNQLRLTAADFKVGQPQVAECPEGRTLVVPLVCAKHAIQVTATYWLGHEAFYLRKELAIDPGEHLVNWVDVESLRLAGQELRRFDQDPMPFPGVPWNIRVGRPLFAGKEFFLGVEHPASLNAFDPQQWISLRQHPGRKGKVQTAPAVIGVCPDRPRQRLLDVFERYIDENRDRAVKRSLQWIAYFTAGMEDDACREKIAVAERVFVQRGVPLDIVLMDSGWTEPQSIMQISRKRPDRLALMSKLVKEKLHATLGLHVITSGVKPMVDKDWLAAQGYDMIYHKSRREGAYCFADPRVFEEFCGNLVSYVKQYGIASYKFDWGHFECGQPGHRGHLPGVEYGFEAGAENFVRVHRALREAKPDIYLFNTGWYSPWWLWHYDAVFASGADYNFGLDGPPSFFTADLLCTWRDATIRGNLVRWSPFFPINSLMTVDPISYWWHDWECRAESPLRPFTDYFLTACLRGTQMIEVYNNIAAWSDAHAEAAAAVLKWMKAHDDVLLASTRYVGGDPLAGEPYGYAHFTKENRGILVVRNPSLQSQTIDIPLDETTGMWPTDKQYVVHVVYPFTMVLPETIRYGSTCRQALDGDEARVLEIWPLDGLHEPMPVGVRYQVTAREPGKTSYRLHAPAGRLEFLSPVALAGLTPVEGQPFRYCSAGPIAGEGTSQKPPRPQGEGPGVRAPEASARLQDGSCLVQLQVPAGAQGRVAIVASQPGLTGELTLDGKPVTPDAPHVRLPDAGTRTHGTRARAATWSLFGLDVGPGDHQVTFRPSAAPKKGLSVSIDLRQDVPGTASIEVTHAPLTRGEAPLLPQYWAWDTRSTDVLRP